MPEPTKLTPCAGGFELRRGDTVAGRLSSGGDGADAEAEAGGIRWQLELHRDRERDDGTWQVLALDARGERAASYYHGGIRGGRLQAADGTSGTLRRALGLGADWRVRTARCALTLRPSAGPAGSGIELDYVTGSVPPADLVLLLVCWCVINEEQIEPLRPAG